MNTNQLSIGNIQRDYILVKDALENKNQLAYTEIVKNYKIPLFLKMLKMTKNPEDANDMTMETFEKAFKQLQQYVPKFAFSTWLFMIGHNNCIDFLRKKKIYDMRYINAIDITDTEDNIIDLTPSTFFTPDEDIIRKDKILKIRKAVDNLSPQYKKIVEMRYYDDYSYEEISLKLNIPANTAKVQALRARKMLYDVFKNNEKFFNEE